MTKTLKNISPLQCGKLLGLTLGLISIVLFVPLFLFVRFGALMKVPDQPGSDPAEVFVGLAMVAASLPVMWGVFGFLFGSIGAAVYNWLARRLGGIEVEVE